jgi:hypothetical protein
MGLASLLSGAADWLTWAHCDAVEIDRWAGVHS